MEEEFFEVVEEFVKWRAQSLLLSLVCLASGSVPEERAEKHLRLGRVHSVLWERVEALILCEQVGRKAVRFAGQRAELP